MGSGVAPASHRLSGGRPRPPLLLRPGVGCFQVADQALEGFLVGVVVLPVAEIRDEVLPNLAGGIFFGVGLAELKTCAAGSLGTTFRAAGTPLADRRSPTVFALDLYIRIVYHVYMTDGRALWP
jgi:hypothetical protein